MKEDDLEDLDDINLEVNIIQTSLTCLGWR